MKINEILTEGPIDFIKKYVPFTAARQQRIGANQQAKFTSDVTNRAYQNWAGIERNLTTAGNAPTAQDAVNWFTKYTQTNTPPTTPPTDLSPAGMKAWLGKEVANYYANRELGKTGANFAKWSQKAAEKAAAKTSPPPPPVSAEDVAKALAKLRGQQQAQPESPLGVSVVQASDAGVVLKYKNRNFMLNNRGEWAMDGKDSAGATVTGQLQAEMDKVAQSTGYM